MSKANSSVMAGINSHSTRKFAALADLLSMTPVIGATVKTQGYRTAGDKGDAEYEVVTLEQYQSRTGRLAPDNFGDHLFSNGAAVAVMVGSRFTAWQYGFEDGKDNTERMTALADFLDGSGRTCAFVGGTFVLNGCMWVDRHKFSLDFSQACKLVLADGANTFAFRLSGCTGFKILGELRADGNKANNDPGGSSAGGANGTISLSGGCLDFSINIIKVKNAWTNGLALDGCSDFSANLLQANDSARRGVTINGCSDFQVNNLRGYEASQNGPVYVLGCTRFDITSVIANGARGSNAVLFEIGNTDFHVGSIVTSDSYAGTKFEDNHRFNVDSVTSLDTSASIGFVLNGGSDINIGKVISRNSAAQGVGLLSAESPLSRVNIDSISVALNGASGCVVQKAENPISAVAIGKVTAASNLGSQFVIQGTGGNEPPFSGDVSISEYFGSGLAPGKFDFEVIGASGPGFGRPSIQKGLYVTNFSEPPALSANAATPSVKGILKFTDVCVTANTAPTIITALDDWAGDNRALYILVQDSNTTFANGSGAGKVVVQGSPVAASFGELWKATFINNFWYLHKVS